MIVGVSVEVVDEAGEIVEGCIRCSSAIAALKVQLAGAHRDINTWRARYAEATRLSEEEDAKSSIFWPAATRCFSWWQERTGHSKSRFDAARFFMIESFLARDGEELCMSAINGAAFDPYITTRRNGTTKRHDGWELIFANRGKFEEFCNKAPRSVRGVFENGDTQMEERANMGCAWCGEKAQEQVRIATRTARKTARWEWACPDCKKRLAARYGDKMGIEQR